MSRLIPGITVVIPSIPPRAGLLRRAVASVLAQSTPAVALSIAVDTRKQGAAVTRQRALDAVQTRWVAFLDDDDEFLPQHLFSLAAATLDYDALYVWSRFQTAIPQPGRRGQRGDFQLRDGPAPLGAGTFEQWNPEQPAQTTITTLVSTELARDVGGFAPPGSGEIDGQRAGEDWDFTLRCVAAAGADRMRHVPEVTWLWHHHANNTSGLPDRW
jgi:hypothetical protein